jgi:hypothetical protein
MGVGEGPKPPLNAATVQPCHVGEGARRLRRTVFSADGFFSMDSFSFRSLEPSLSSSVNLSKLG